MNQGPLLFLGILATLASSFWGLVLVPDMHIGHQSQITNTVNGMLYPAPRGGMASRGAEVYRSMGCVECHSQQVRGVGPDLSRGWGPRMTVAQDYLGDYPVMAGNQRIGPDLANIGMRQPSAPELLRHLYEPQVITPGSMMPPYRFLFTKRKLRPDQRPDPSAIMLVNGYEVLPGPEAEALAGYLLSLRLDTPLYEAPVPRGTAGASNSKTNAPVLVDTNTGAAAPTNVSSGSSGVVKPAGTNRP